MMDIENNMSNTQGLLLFIIILFLIALVILTIEYFEHKKEIKDLRNNLLKTKLEVDNIKTEKPLKPIKGGVYYLLYFRLESSQYYFHLAYETTFEKAKKKTNKKNIQKQIQLKTLQFNTYENRK